MNQLPLFQTASRSAGRSFKDMQKRSADQEKAIAWYVTSNSLRMKLSAHPIYNFVDQSGKDVSMSIHRIVALHKASQEKGDR